MDMADSLEAADDFYEDSDFSNSFRELGKGGESLHPPERVFIDYKPWALYDKEVVKLPVVGRHVGQR